MIDQGVIYTEELRQYIDRLKADLERCETFFEKTKNYQYVIRESCIDTYIKEENEINGNNTKNCVIEDFEKISINNEVFYV